jgi:hypothetical protein
VSKRINVNPDHYKVAGRERPGDAVAKAKEHARSDKEAVARWQKRSARVKGNGKRKGKG